MFTTKNNRVLCFFLFLSLPNLFPLISSQEDDYQYTKCLDQNGYYVRNGTYEKNLDKILRSLALNTNQSGYYATSAGNTSDDKVNAMVLCRGDVNDTNTCRGCIAKVASRLKNECYAIKEALGGSNKCFLFYTNNSLSGIVDNPTDYMMNPFQNVSQVDRFNKGLMTLLNDLRVKAASGGNLRKYAAGKYPMEGYLTVYAFVQCTPVLSESQCNDCLTGAIGEIYGCCNRRAGGRVVKPSCNLRYENTPFIRIDQNTLNNAPMSPDSPTGKKKNKTVIIVVSTIASLVAIVIFTFIILKLKKKKQRTQVPRLHFEEVNTADDISFEKSLQYDLTILSAATDNFSDANKLGHGGFGAVYKGVLPDGQEIAVKRLSQGSGQGEHEFKNEVALVAKLQQRNLVRLLGFCVEGAERILIYEFFSNGSLDQILFDPVKRTSLDWNARYRIIEGIARGLLYLHEDSRVRIIHRDLKASNILLDKDMIPKVSDFGMARLFDIDESQGNTNTIAGTYGYMAPEYAMHGNFSFKSDVYSFGVLVLEIVSGEKNNSFRQGEDVQQDLLSFAWKHWKEGTATEVVDPALRVGDADSIPNIMKCIQIGLLCIQECVSDRPTMQSVVVMLNSSSITISVPTQPAFYLSGRINPEVVSPESSTTTDSTNANVRSIGVSVNELSVSELSPR